VKLTSRSATRSRLYVAGTFFRSIERGEQANLIKIAVVEDGAEGTCVVHHTRLKPDEQIFATGMEVPTLALLKLTIDWNQELRIKFNGTEWRAELTGIRWQIAAGPTPPAVDLGQVHDGLFSAGNISFKVTGIGGWPTGAVVYLRPRTRRYPLVSHVVTDQITMQSTIGWDPGALRAALNADTTGFVYMPARGSALIAPTSGGEDAQDTGVDDDILSALAPTNMGGGDGLPSTPVGLNTGPDRVMIHLNYSEKDDGSMGVLNQVFEWVGDTASIGSWQRYS
jgi:hypothetical protein